jgi:hypothetical protein
MGVAWSEKAPSHESKNGAQAGQQLEAAGGIEPPYGALWAPAFNGLTWGYLVA